MAYLLNIKVKVVSTFV